MFTLATCCLTMSLDLTFPASYAILFLTASDFTFSMRHIHNGASFPLWRSCFILYGAICNCPLLFPVAYWTSSDQRGSSSGVIFFFYLFVLYMGLSRKNTGVGCYFLLQWITFCQNFSLYLSWWPCMAWFIVSLSYTSPFTMARVAVS